MINKRQANYCCANKDEYVKPTQDKVIAIPSRGLVLQGILPGIPGRWRFEDRIGIVNFTVIVRARPSAAVRSQTVVAATAVNLMKVVFIALVV